jgi:ferredoxin
MRVWIDQKFCTGDGLCEDLCPAVFTLKDDGLAYVKEGEVVRNPGGRDGVAAVPAGLADAVRDAQDQCAGECIFIEE